MIIIYNLVKFGQYYEYVKPGIMILIHGYYVFSEEQLLCHQHVSILLVTISFKLEETSQDIVQF